MDLILDKKDVFKTCFQNWMNKWVPAIIVYGNSLKGKTRGFLKRVEAEYQGSK